MADDDKKFEGAMGLGPDGKVLIGTPEEMAPAMARAKADSETDWAKVAGEAAEGASLMDIEERLGPEDDVGDLSDADELDDIIGDYGAAEE